MTMHFECIRLGSIPSGTSITAFYSENTMVLTIQEKTRQDKIQCLNYRVYLPTRVNESTKKIIKMPKRPYKRNSSKIC